MNWYPWLNAPYRQLIGQYRAGRGHHALLLHALPGCGDESLVYAIGRWLLCQRPDGDKSCGECHGCRLMIAGNHPDWHLLQPEKGKSSLGIEPVRQVIEQLYSHARQDGARVVWISSAESLTEAAANALLKTLEEPPADTFFLLSTREPANLLATLRSRCLYLYISPPDEASSLRWMQSQRAGEVQIMTTALRLSGGAPAAALALLEPTVWRQRAELCTALAQALPQRQWLNLLPALNHDDVDMRLNWLCSLLLDAVKLLQHAGQYVVNQDQLSLVQQLASGLSLTTLQQQLEQWIHCRHQLLTTAALNRELMLTEQLCRWQEADIAPSI